MKENKIFLMIVLWELYDIDSLESIELNFESAEYLKDQNNLEERKKIYNALKWAKQNPNFNFKDVMEGAPVAGELSFSNNEVFEYLMMLKQFFDNQEFSLLTDDRPPFIP